MTTCGLRQSTRDTVPFSVTCVFMSNEAPLPWCAASDVWHVEMTAMSARSVKACFMERNVSLPTAGVNNSRGRHTSAKTATTRLTDASHLTDKLSLHGVEN